MAGPLFFGNQEQIITKVNEILNECNNIIFSMRGVPSIDDSGIREFIDVVELCRQNNINCFICWSPKKCNETIQATSFRRISTTK